jgi:hypothetical protein
MFKFNFQLNNKTYKVLKNGIAVKLYYSNGVADRLLTPIDLLTYNRQSIKELKFVPHPKL